MATETKTLEAGEVESASMIDVKQGQWLAFKDGRWFKCNDVNLKLNRSLSKLGVALAAFQYEDGIGAQSKDIQTFTLRQYYQDPTRPTLAYCEEWLKKFIAGIHQYQGSERRQRLVDILGPVLKQFERDYKAFDEEEPRVAEIHAKESRGLVI